MSDPQINVPDMCQTHQALLLRQVGLGPNDPWMSCIIACQIVLFQGTTAHQTTYERIGGDILRLSELGCLACYRPDVFGQFVMAWQEGGMAATKALGERLVANGALPSTEPETPQ